MVAAARMSRTLSITGQSDARRDSVRSIVRATVDVDSLVWRVDSTDLSQFGAGGLTRHKVVCETALLLVVAQRHLCGDDAIVAAIQGFLSKALDLTIDARMVMDLDR